MSFTVTAPSVIGNRYSITAINFKYYPNIIIYMAKQPDWTLKEIELLKRSYTTKTKEELLRLFPNRTWLGLTHKASKIKTGIRSNTRRERGYNAKYGMNEHFFKKWNGDVAYVFGRLITDGSWRLRDTGGEMRIKSIDKENLEKIRFVMESDHKIKKEKTERGTWIYVFDIYNNEMVRDLLNLENKIEHIILHENFFGDFLRGFMDGDGGLNITDNNLRVVLTNKNKEILEQIKTRLGYGVIYSKEEKYYTLNFLNGNNFAEKVCELMYLPKPFLYLSRKYSRWELWKEMKKRHAKI